MRIAYVSTDEVNQDLAERIAAKHGVGVCKRLPTDRKPDDQCDAVLYNLDDIPPAERSALIEGFRSGKLDHPTAVHGYDITDEEARTLSRNGVSAARRLRSDLLCILFTAACRNRETVPPDGDTTDLTWVNLTDDALETEPSVLPFDPPANPRNRRRSGGDRTPLSPLRD